MKTNIDIPSLTQACKHIYRYSQQIPQAWTHPFTSTLKYCYITYCKTWKSSQIHSHKCFCCSVTQSCLTFCGPMDCSTPGFPVLFHLPEFAHSCPLSRWCHPTISSSVTPPLLLPSIFPSIRVFSNESALRIRWPRYWIWLIDDSYILWYLKTGNEHKIIL